MLPAYSFLLGLIALLGYVALAAGVVTKDANSAVPLLFLKMFPEWFAGFCLAAMAVGRWCRRRSCRLRLRICLRGIFGASF